MLLRFAAGQQGRDVAVLDVERLTAAVVIAFLSDLETTRPCAELGPDLGADALVFVNHRAVPFTRFWVRFILAKYLHRVAATQPRLARMRLHPHSLRHGTAVHS